MANAAVMFFGQGLNYLLIVVNVRACAKGMIGMAAFTDFAICILSFTLIQRVSKAETLLDKLAYACGGTIGSVAAILLTKAWDA